MKNKGMVNKSSGFTISVLCRQEEESFIRLKTNSTTALTQCVPIFITELQMSVVHYSKIVPGLETFPFVSESCQKVFVTHIVSLNKEK